MEVKNLVLFVVILILVIIVYQYVTKDTNTLAGLSSGKQSQDIKSSALAGDGTSVNFAYSIWINISDWNYRYGENKTIFGRYANPAAGVYQSSSGDSSNVACPELYLGSTQNNIILRMNVSSDANAQETCQVSNIPIQTWTNIIVSVYNRTLDMYLDGKLVKTCILGGVPNITPVIGKDVYVTPGGGFSGWTSNFQYFNNSIDPQQAWDIYSKGYGASWLGNVFGRYKIKVAVMDGETENSSVVI
jgi:Concanavalin A-like lectin/glucanases superfamily